MKVTPVATPAARQDASNQASHQVAQDARARAIAKLANPTGIQNASAVQPEEMGAITSGQLSASEDTEVTEPIETAEVAQEATPAEEPIKTEVPVSSQLALLARKEKALRAKQQQQDQGLKSREQALQAREDALKAKEQEYATGYIPKARLKQNPLQALADAEISYDEITQAQIEAQNVNPQVTAHIQRLEAKLAKLETQAEEGTKAQAEAQTQSYQAAVKQISADAKKLITTDPAFETIKATGSTKDVVELIEATFKDTGELLSVEEAAQLVEDHLIEEIEKLMKIEKIKKRQVTANASQKPAQTQTPNTPKQPQPMKTLTNASSSTRTLGAKERAILAFKGQLKA